MSLKLSYPGVYVQELPSGNATVVGAGTSVAAFLGRSACGSTTNPMTISSYAEFQSFYGGLTRGEPMSYSVRDFFQNGGSQAVIVRLFEPNSMSDSGLARLRFPPSGPALPDGWRLASAAKAGDTILKLAPPPNSSEGEPDPGMRLTLGGESGKLYTVLAYTPASGTGDEATIAIFPALVEGLDYCGCCGCYFHPAEEPSGWLVAPGGSGSVLIVSGGEGLPQLGHQFTLSSDPAGTLYTITELPTTQVDPSNGTNLLINIGSFRPTLAQGGSFSAGTKVTFSEPSPSPLPVGWQVSEYSIQGTGPTSVGMLQIINGAGEPLLYDQFTAGGDAVYKVTGFTPADDTKTPAVPAMLTFAPSDSADGLPGLTDVTNCSRCSTLEFLSRVPSGYAIKTAPPVGGTSLVAGVGPTTTGPIEPGTMFTVRGDAVVYVVRVFESDSQTVLFLPQAATDFTGKTMSFSPPLCLSAANPGKWANRLTAQVDTKGITDRTASATTIAKYGLERSDLFNLTLTLKDSGGGTVKTERFLNLSVRNDEEAAHYPGRLDLVLASQSTLATIEEGALPFLPPEEGCTALGVGGNDGQYLDSTTYLGDEHLQTGIYMLEKTAFNLLCIPPDQRLTPRLPLSLQDVDPTVRQAAAIYCTDRRAMYIADGPAAWAAKVAQGLTDTISPDDMGIAGQSADGIEYERNVAVYFPRIFARDVLANGAECLFSPCGAIAGAIASNDVGRGVWKAPAGINVGLAGVTRLESHLTDEHSGILNPLGINCLRTFPVYGNVIYGARTLRGADLFEDDYKYLSVRRLTLYVESSLVQSTQWAVFEPNNEALWSSLRLSVNAFLSDLAKQGAFYNYKVTCDGSNHSVEDIERGVVNLLVQLAPVDPAEFVCIQIQQVAPKMSA